MAELQVGVAIARGADSLPTQRRAGFSGSIMLCTLLPGRGLQAVKQLV